MVFWAHRNKFRKTDSILPSLCGYAVLYSLSKAGTKTILAKFCWKNSLFGRKKSLFLPNVVDFQFWFVIDCCLYLFENTCSGKSRLKWPSIWNELKKTNRNELFFSLVVDKMYFNRCPVSTAWPTFANVAPKDVWRECVLFGTVSLFDSFQ